MSPAIERICALPEITWRSIVSYDDAVLLSSTDYYGENNRTYLDNLSIGACESRAHGAWMANDRQAYVVYMSAARHKRNLLAE